VKALGEFNFQISLEKRRMLTEINRKLEGVTEQVTELQTNANMLNSRINDVQVLNL
jgi:conjugal transfer/entry exclusion protein